MNPQDCVWKNLYRIIMKTILQEKGHFTAALQHGTKIHSYAPSLENSCGKGGSGQAWNRTKVRSKKEVIDEARTKGAKDHFASLMDICHLKNAELETKHPKYKGRVVLRGGIVKDDSGLMQYSLNKDHQHLKWQPPKVMDIISRLPGCAGQAADAVSAYTQVKMEDAPKLLKIPESEGPDIWIRLPRHKWPKSWSSMEDPVVPLERNLYGHPLAGLLWERQFEKILLKYGREKVSNLRMLIRTP